MLKANNIQKTPMEVTINILTFLMWNSLILKVALQERGLPLQSMMVTLRGNLIMIKLVYNMLRVVQNLNLDKEFGHCVTPCLNYIKNEI